MILHLVSDEKVIPRMMDLFEKYYSENIFLCVSLKRQFEDLKILQKRENLYLLYGGHLNNIPWNKIEKVCIHSLDPHKILAYEYLNLLYGLKPSIIIWFPWGADYYGLAEKKGFKIYSENNSRQKNPYTSIWKNIFFRTYNFLGILLKIPFIKYKINYLAASTTEMDLIKNVVKMNHLYGRLDFTYYSIEDVLKNIENPEVIGSDIIIGNSASASNNHEYIYDYIKKLCFKGENIHIPMSYGAFPKYMQSVCKLYNQLPNVQILTDFLTIDTYNQMLCNCSTFIYGHFRQEGWGNIIVALFLGGKVYLPKDSQNYKNFNQFGFKIFKLEDIHNTYLQKMTKEDKEHNRTLALSHFSKNKNKEYIEHICNL